MRRPLLRERRAEPPAPEGWLCRPTSLGVSQIRPYDRRDEQGVRVGIDASFICLACSPRQRFSLTDLQHPLHGERRAPDVGVLASGRAQETDEEAEQGESNYHTQDGSPVVKQVREHRVTHLQSASFVVAVR
ncbi:hypothetical protein ALI22I_34135 [Saccharothrix sp. ALI-22-I]|nr:hypothetical protein ALI22I_34135 [Saccharothrix sp. ALI-22-I]